MPRPANLDRWCFTWLADSSGPPEPTHAAILPQVKWELRGDGRPLEITVSFLGGEPSLWQAIEGVAGQWIARTGANLRFAFVGGGSGGDIRISFDRPGSWSALGTTCLKVPRERPTMNFGWLRPRSTPSEIRRAVLHEFGHALGLVHEHSSPAADIEWDRNQVYHDLQKAGWDVATINQNIFFHYGKELTQFTEFDRRSIMLYPIPQKWLRSGSPVAMNDDLSQTDIRFVEDQYAAHPS